MDINYISEDDIDLKGVFKGSLKKKWWFVGTFIIILIAGLFIMYLRDPGIQPINDYIIGGLISLFSALIGGLMVVFVASYSTSFR